mmetsp:Transcript_52850/g.99044  ORF Transcript_52850/g.99044 Transcript_52850/m.99044 type:complete len:220 (-) Transcript_52850:482-1141(-)
MQNATVPRCVTVGSRKEKVRCGVCSTRARSATSAGGFSRLNFLQNCSKSGLFNPRRTSTRSSRSIPVAPVRPPRISIVKFRESTCSLRSYGLPLVAIFVQDTPSRCNRRSCRPYQASSNSVMFSFSILACASTSATACLPPLSEFFPNIENFERMPLFFLAGERPLAFLLSPDGLAHAVSLFAFASSSEEAFSSAFSSAASLVVSLLSSFLSLPAAAAR